MTTKTSIVVALLSVSCLPIRVSSTTPMADTSEVSLISRTTWLPIGGNTFSRACGRTTRRMIDHGLMPSARAASRWRRLTASMPPRNTSAR